MLAYLLNKSFDKQRQTRSASDRALLLSHNYLFINFSLQGIFTDENENCFYPATRVLNNDGSLDTSTIPIGMYWSSSIPTTNNKDLANYLYISNSDVLIYYNYRSNGQSVRCVKE